MDKSKNGKVYNRNIGMERLESLVERLRDPISGCPWDIEQDNKSIAHYCIEEAHELQHAISLNKKDAIKSELGDLLFQIAFHCHIAEKDYGFTFDDVVQDVCDKMIFRHPHVFNKEKRDGSSISTKEVKDNWEKIKSLEKNNTKNPKRFFGKEAEENLSWFQKFSSVHNDQFENTKWFNGGLINVSHNCIDRHLDKHSEKTALIWEGDDPQDNKMISYQGLYEQVCQFANILKKLNVKKGTRVCIYMPMIPEAAFAMLACTRIGAIHSVVFG